MRKLYLIISVLLANMAYSQTEIVDKLQGSWQGDGNLMGSKAIFFMTWENKLNDQFLQLNFSSKREFDSTKYISFEATAIYKPGSDEWLGTWYDVRGMILPLSATVSANKLSVDWGSKDTEQGRTVYEINGTNKIQVIDFILNNNEYKQFGVAYYSRVKR